MIAVKKFLGRSIWIRPQTICELYKSKIITLKIFKKILVENPLNFRNFLLENNIKFNKQEITKITKYLLENFTKDKNFKCLRKFINKAKLTQTIKIECEPGILFLIKFLNRIKKLDKIKIKLNYGYFPLNYFMECLHFLYEHGYNVKKFIYRFDFLEESIIRKLRFKDLLLLTRIGFELECTPAVINFNKNKKYFLLKYGIINNNTIDLIINSMSFRYNSIDTKTFCLLIKKSKNPDKMRKEILERYIDSEKEKRELFSEYINEAKPIEKTKKYKLFSKNIKELMPIVNKLTTDIALFGKNLNIKEKNI